MREETHESDAKQLKKEAREEARESYHQGCLHSSTCFGMLGTHVGTDEDKLANGEARCCSQSVGPEGLTLQ